MDATVFISNIIPSINIGFPLLTVEADTVCSCLSLEGFPPGPSICLGYVKLFLGYGNN